MSKQIIIAYSATSISILGRLIFMYLLYTQKSINPYSLIFCLITILSSSLWIDYSQLVSDVPLLVRGSSDLVLFTISASYILYNRSMQDSNKNIGTEKNITTEKIIDIEKIITTEKRIETIV